jgi:hypothetical protein
MTYIQVVTNEWIDILYINNNNITRKSNNDKGFINKFDDNQLAITWNIWGTEYFIKKQNIYYNCKENIFEIFLENEYWNDIGIFNINNNTISRKYCQKEKGTYYFDNNDLIIIWENWGNERFYQLNFGKFYSNKIFGNQIKNSKHKHIKMLAIVFPQFHEIPENNEFWGKGFTEWTLLKNIPRIVNGEIIKQPHDDIGYFNLNDYNHRKYMKQLADKFNIYGFCYYHYWFKNKKVMYEPTELMLKDGEPNKPFLFCWANEQWTKRWDGGNHEILIDQDYSDLDGNISHFYYLLDFFKHPNYIKKFNKPIFIFYRIEESDIKDIKNIIILWNKLAKDNGFNGIHFMKFLGPFNNNIFLDEINGYVEFEPGYACQEFFNEIISEDENKIFVNSIFNEQEYLNKNKDIKELINNNIIKSALEHHNSIPNNERQFRTSKFNVFDGKKLYDKILDLKRIHPEQHRGISLNWNNTPRRNYSNNEYDKYPHYYKNIDPQLFKKTLNKLLHKIDNDPNKEDDFLFISAWNEWNEQAILEPNNYDGYSYLKSLSDSYLDFYDNPYKKIVLNMCHIGGGTEKYMNDLKKYYNEYYFIDFNNFNFETNYDELYKNIDFIHINSILFNNLRNNYIYLFTNYFINVKKIITIHDYQWLFPDDPNIIKENFNLKKIENNNIKNFENLLELSSCIIFPSYNIYNNYCLYVDLKNDKIKDKIKIINHFDKIINHNFLVIPQIKNIINIAFIGYFIEYKGSHIFKDLSLKCTTFKNYVIKYHIYGSSNDYIDNPNNNIIFHNSYNDSEIIKNLHENNIHGLMHLSLFEESYCYALTNSINSGIPIFYLNRGAISERLIDKNKYFSFELNNIIDIYYKFLDYICINNNIKDIYKLNEELQPNREYLMNIY